MQRQLGDLVVGRRGLARAIRSALGRVPSAHRRRRRRRCPLETSPERYFAVTGGNATVCSAQLAAPSASFERPARGSLPIVAGLKRLLRLADSAHARSHLIQLLACAIVSDAHRLRLGKFILNPATSRPPLGASAARRFLQVAIASASPNPAPRRSPSSSDAAIRAARHSRALR